MAAQLGKRLLCLKCAGLLDISTAPDHCDELFMGLMTPEERKALSDPTSTWSLALGKLGNGATSSGLDRIPGMSPAMVAALNKVGLYTAGDVVRHPDLAMSVPGFTPVLLDNAAESHNMKANASVVVSVLSQQFAPLTGLPLPMCTSCLEDEHVAGRLKLTLATKHVEKYQRFLDQIQLEDVDEDGQDAPLQLVAEEARLQAELDQLLAQEAALMKDLDALASQKHAVQTASKKLDTQSKRLTELECKHWETVGKERSLLLTMQAECYSAQQRDSIINTLLDGYHQLSVLSDAFFIWQDGAYGTIAGLRLGQGARDSMIDWNEVNGALGYAAMLVAIIAHHRNVAFSQYTIGMMGNTTKLITKQGGTTYLLCFDSSYFATRKFNNALKAFVTCVADLCEQATTEDRSLRIPYAVNRDHCTIGEASCLYGDPAGWTKAMKNLLTNLKWLIFWFCKHQHAALG